jgi:hypothetical protein
MPGKSKGKLVYCSEFISLEGRIRIPNISGQFKSDHPDFNTRKIIYLGSNRDPWWNTEQLLA